MKSILLLTFLFLLTFNSRAQQLLYTGSIDKYPISFSLYLYSDGVSYGFYVYDKFDTPIQLMGESKNGKLVMNYLDSLEKPIETIEIANFSAEKNQLTGTWKPKSGGSKKITLTKTLELEDYDDHIFSRQPILCNVSSEDCYYQLLISKEKDEEIVVSGLRIFEKGTDKLIQEMDASGEYRGFDALNIDDYNFDGIDDFSIFEASYAGPNTSRTYFLRDPKTEQFFQSDFTGTSLEFDQEKKLIYEHNSCCAGRSIMTATYTVENNTMVLQEQHCMEYNDETEDYVEKPCEE